MINEIKRIIKTSEIMKYVIVEMLWTRLIVLQGR